MVAAIDLNLNDDIPQTPCPLVQPFAVFVPNPTRIPANI